MVGLNRRQLWMLFRLRGKLSLRLFSQEKGRLVGVILIIFLAAPLIAGATIGTVIGYRRLPEPWPGQLLGGVLVALWGIWLLFPILFSGVNEGADITRLLIYPISRRDLITNVFLGTLFDYPTYLVLPLFGAVLVGWSRSLLILPVIIIALFLGYLHLVLIGQLVMAVFGGILQSRRFRDIVIILASLLGSACYFLQTAFGRWVEEASQTMGEETLLALRPLNTLQWLPTGALARSIDQAAAGAWLSALLWIVYSAAWLIIMMVVWWTLLERLTTGGGYLLSVSSGREKKQKKRVRSHTRSRLRFLPPDIHVLMIKELKSIWRLPQRRAGLFQGILFPFIMAGAFAFSEDFSGQLPSWIGLGLPLYALFIFWATTQNMLAWEGHGLAALFQTPISRQRIFLAKGLAFMLVGGIPFFVVGLIIIRLSSGWESVAGVITGLNVGLTTAGVASVTSVLFPMRVNLDAKRRQHNPFSTGGGCITGLAMMFLVPLLIWLAAMPTGLPLVAGTLLEQPLIGVGGTFIAMLYAVFVFWLGTYLGGQLLLQREPEVFVALKQPENSD